MNAIQEDINKMRSANLQLTNDLQKEKDLTEQTNDAYQAALKDNKVLEAKGTEANDGCESNLKKATADLKKAEKKTKVVYQTEYQLVNNVESSN